MTQSKKSKIISYVIFADKSCTLKMKETNLALAEKVI